MTNFTSDRPSELTTPGPNLVSVFLRSPRSAPEHLALATRDGKSTYGELLERSGRIARILSAVDRPAPCLGAVLGARSQSSFAGILATLLSGAGYVPLNPKFPIARTLYMLQATDCRTLVVDKPAVTLLPALLAEIQHELLVVIPDLDDSSELKAQFPHRFVFAAEVAAAEPLTADPPVLDDSIAYLLFTSGSTGVPKGVTVSHRNVLHYLNVMWDRYSVTPDDRFSQTFDTTFDLSVHDMFLCWGRGASLHCLSANDLMAPAQFINKNQITMWFSVPSIGLLMHRLGQLKPESFSSVRLALFCGEPLPASVAAAWQAAAPRAIVENVYGPTEVTIACTAYRWQTVAGASAGAEIVPIGIPLVGLSAVLVDEQLQRVPVGSIGELCMAGPQVTPGYWRDVEKTAERFVAMPWHSGPENRWYRTGDLAVIDAGGDLLFRGRSDSQVKIRGFRVELTEIEEVLRAGSQSSSVVVLPFPRNDLGPIGTTAFIANSKIDKSAILAHARDRLADYMVPVDIISIDQFPLNSNGKVDKNQLMKLLEK